MLQEIYLSLLFLKVQDFLRNMGTLTTSDILDKGI